MKIAWPGPPKASLLRAAVVAAIAALLAGGSQASAPPPVQQPAPAPQQPSEVAVVISGDPGTPPRYAIPDFVALTPDAAEMAKTVGQVLWDDLAFEREFYLIPRDTYTTIPAARSPDQIPFDAWRELGADARRLRHGAEDRRRTCASRSASSTSGRRQSVFSKEYTGTA